MSIHLDEAAVDQLCYPLTQRAAQTRFVCQLLGVERVKTRRDGLPLVTPAMVEKALGGGQTTTSDNTGFNWSN